jgi:deazaflavin-dependent oxidoreductase (nitroreductase family)
MNQPTRTQGKQMTTKKYNPFNRLMQKIAYSRPGAWFYARALPHLDRLVLKLSRGRTNLTSLVTGLPVVFITTRGARSGLKRTLPLLYIQDEHDPDSFALIASNWGQAHYPAWYFNLKADPQAVCAIEGRTADYLAREVSGEEYERIWQAAVDLYIGYSAYKQRVGKRHIPVFVMTPVER